ncbi:MAG: hypothetical protein ABI579_04100 [Candidatus Sumerlaeota bacterium]
MKRTHLLLAAALIAGTSPSYALFVANVNTTGSAGAFTTVQAAVDACTASADPVCRVDIIEAATYDDPLPADSASTVVVPGGYALTIQGTVAGVIIDQSAGLANAVSSSAGAGVLNLTLNNLTLRRQAGTGPTLKFDARAADTVTVSITNCTVTQTLASGGGEALKLDVGAEDGPGVTINITNSTLTSASSLNNKAAIRVQSNGADFDNLTLNITDSTINTQDSGIRLSAASPISPELENLKINILRSTINSLIDRGIEFDNPAGGAIVNVTDSTFNCEDEAIIMATTARPSPNTVWTFNRCVINKTVGAASAVRAVDLRFTDATFSSRLAFYNCVFRTPTAAANARAIDVADCLADVYHCTFLATGSAGTTGPRAISSANTSAAPGSTVVTMSNNIFLNYGQPTPSTEDVVGGSTINSNNLVAGPVTDSNLGASTVYTAAASGDSANITAAGLDSITLVPQSGSVAVAAGDPSSTIATAIGAVDFNNAARPNPTGTNPDIGAFETPFGGTSAAFWVMYY